MVNKAIRPMLHTTQRSAEPVAPPCFWQKRRMWTALCFGALPLAAAANEITSPDASWQRSSADIPQAGQAINPLVLQSNQTLAAAKIAPAVPVPVQPTNPGRASAPSSDNLNPSAGPASAAGAEILLLELQVNGVALPGIARVELWTDGRLLLPVDSWTESRLIPPTIDSLALSDNQRGYAIQDVPGISYELNRGLLTLTLVAPANAFQAATVALGAGRMTPPQPSTPGIYLNYDASVSRVQGHTNTYGVFVESVAFNGPDSFVSGAVVTNDGLVRKSFRTETYWRRDLPGTMEALVLGDTTGSGGAWSRPVRYGGIRFARDFSLAPGFITYPMPALQGSAALPSTVDLIINNQKRSNLSVGPGPFSVTNVPVVSGSGEANLVVRDLRGVETVITQKYYSSPRLLAEGLSDFSVDAGKLRRNFGQPDSSYGSGFAAAAYRYGLTPALTGETRVEAQKERKAVGLEAAGLLGTAAVLQGAVAWSRNDNNNDTRSAARSGGRYLLALERSAPQGGNGSIQLEHFDAGFRQFGDLGFESRPRDRTQVQTGVALGGLSLGASFTRLTTWEGDNFRLGAINLGTRIFDSVFFNLYASKRLGSGGGWSTGLNLIMPLEKQRTLVATTSRDNGGRYTTAVQASQSAPVGQGWGWRVRASDQANQRAQAGALLNSDVGQFQAEANSGSGTNALRFGANGSVGWLTGLPFATRSIGHGAFAVVKVADLADVPVYRSNQITTTTNGNGLALVTGLLPFQANKLSIDPDEVPFNMDIQGVEEMVTPYARSGVVVNFPVRRMRNALVVINQADGTPVPAGAVVTLLPGSAAFVIGKRGEAYLTGLNDSNQLQVKWTDGACELTVAMDPVTASEPRIGPLTCPTGK